MQAVEFTFRPHSGTSAMHTLTYHMLWGCPLLAFAFGYMNFCLYIFGRIYPELIVSTVAFPIALTVIALLVNVFIELTHLPPRVKQVRSSSST